MRLDDNYLYMRLLYHFKAAGRSFALITEKACKKHAQVNSTFSTDKMPTSMVTHGYSGQCHEVKASFSLSGGPTQTKLQSS